MKKINSVKFILSIALFVFVSANCNVFAQDTSKTVQSTYRPKTLQSIEMAKETISRVLNDKCVWVMDTTISKKKLKYKKAIVTDEGIQLEMRSRTKTIYFAKLLGDQDISLRMWHTLYYNAKTGEKYRDDYVDEIIGTNNIYFEKYHAGFGVTMPNPSDYPTCNRQLADALHTIQKKLSTKRYSSRLAAFKPLAEKYRALKTKPKPPEEQRKCVVQATFFVRQKKTKLAKELYKKALAIDSTDFPIVYYDLANLYADDHSYSTAIFYMKEYLMLIPDSTNARAAQDQIYEWDAIVNPPK